MSKYFFFFYNYKFDLNCIFTSLYFMMTLVRFFSVVLLIQYKYDLSKHSLLKFTFFLVLHLILKKKKKLKLIFYIQAAF